MFDNLTMNHDEIIQNIIKLRDSISEDMIVQAFLLSLSSRRLDYRSAIATWSLAHELNLHTYDPVISGTSYSDGKEYHSYVCKTCRNSRYGIVGYAEYKDIDLNVLNFERLKWGGIRHGDLVYMYLDLKLFSSLSLDEPTDLDLTIFQEILKTIETSNPEDYPSALSKRLKDIEGLKSSKDERDQLIENLAAIDVLKPKSYDRPIKGRNDWVFVEFWRGEDSYDKETVSRLFGGYYE